MSILSFIESLGKKIHSELVAIFGQPAIDNLDSQIKTILTGDVKVIFADAVTAADSLMVGGVAATGDQKKSAAFAQISTDLQAQGKSLAANVINLGIELIVGLLKGKTPA